MSGPPRSLAIVTPFYPPHVGGVERYSQEFARAALALGVSVNVITTDSVRRPEERVEDGGIRVLRMPARNLPIMGSHYPIAATGWPRAEVLLDCDVVIAQTRFFMTTLAAAWIAARRGKRICVVDHGSGPLRTSPKALAFASLLYERAATEMLKRKSPRFLAVSGASAQWLRSFGIADAQIVPNGIAPTTRPPFRSDASLDRPVVFYAGRLLREKGVCELIDGVETLIGRGHDIQLRIAGKGPLSSSIANRAAKSTFLTFLGHLRPAEITAELNRASMFVNPSNYAEGLPTILLEAGSAALPVISTPRGGSVDLIRDGETGWIIPRGEPAAIAAALEDAMSKPHDAIVRGNRLFALIQDRYTWPSIVSAFLERSPSTKESLTA